MKKVPIKTVVEDLKKLFKIDIHDKEFASYESNGSFGIDKRQFERFDVINKLQDYFSDKVIGNGYCEVKPITFVHTIFKIKEGVPDENS